MPMLIVVSMFKTINGIFSLGWQINFQEINVSDSSSGSGGDITINKNNNVIMSVEVTERPVDRARVVSTFRTKIAPGGIEDYLFLVHLRQVADEAQKQAHNYFAQGHDVNFVDIKEWIINSLVTIGKKGRELFFVIKDTGVGVPEKEKRYIFRKFYRAENALKRKTRGSGLGLYVCKSIVEKSGGRIWFDSEENKGTTFYFTLPINKEKFGKFLEEF